jgi:DNA polymerase-1
MTQTQPTLHLIDGHSLTFKAYYAIQNLTNTRGESTGAVFGFLRMLLKFIDEQHPSHLAIVFDTGKPTFRSQLLESYKANREAPPADFGVQMGWIYELLKAMGVVTHHLDGYEADDLIATMAEQHKVSGGKAVVLTADKDLMQLVDPQVSMLRPNSGPRGGTDLKLYDEAAVLARMGVTPAQVPDWLALVGDSSDNIPGVPGIGEKGAAQLLQEYATLENLLAHAAELKKAKQREALTEYADRARMARELATVKRDVPMTWNLAECVLPADPWTAAAQAIMVDLGFQSILKERGLDAEAIARSTPAAASPIVIHYRALQTEAELAAWVAEARQAPWLALDTETTSTDVMTADLVGLSFSHAPGQAVYIPVGHRPELAGGDQLPLETVRTLLTPLLDGSGPRLTGHHAKFDWKMLVRAGFTPADPAFDSMIANYLLDPDSRPGHGLKALGAMHSGMTMRPISELIGSGARQLTMAELAIADVVDYASADADATLRLTQHFIRELEAQPELKRLMQEMELPLIGVLMEMELGGFNLDGDCLRDLGVRLRGKLNELARTIWEQAGHTFNIGSPKQVGALLFEELKLPVGRKGKTGYSTDEAELERLAALHPVPKLILEYRGIEKLQSTYIDSLPILVNSRSGRIHTSFNQTTAATGRLSSTDPNLQNIPIRTELGREIRRAFIADNRDHLLVKADYSQIELRILAHISGDPALRSAYREGRDIHRQTASLVFGVDPQDVTREMRSQAKTINFGIVYGISAHGLAQQLGVGRAESGQFIQRYFETYSGVRRWIDELLEEARRTGMVRTLLGRRRLVPGVNERNAMIRSNAERVAVNSPIQGTSADMIKRAMIRIGAGLAQAAPGARMICQVHDELVFSVPRERIEPAEAFIREAMATALPLDVPVEVDVHHGPNWAEC